jgi:hypothetical protein
MNISLSEKQTDVIFSKMFSFVNEKYTIEFTKDPDWFRSREWNKDAENLFKNWLAKYFNQQLEMKKSLAIKAAEWFLLNYGWKIKE